MPKVRTSESDPRRRPGRPSAAYGADRRARLLDVAAALFGERGFAATPLREIARRAKVTPALLHYYFGDKDKLVDALIAERLMPVVAELRGALARSGGDSVDLAASFVNTVFDLIARHAWFPQLWVREVLSEGGALRDLIVERIAPQVPQQMEQQFRAAQRRGELNAALDPRLLVVSLVGLTLFAAAGAPIWSRIFRVDDVDIDALRRHALALLDGGIGMPRRRT